VLGAVHLHLAAQALGARPLFVHFGSVASVYAGAGLRVNPRNVEPSVTLPVPCFDKCGVRPKPYIYTYIYKYIYIYIYIYMRCMRYTYVQNMIYMIYSSFLHLGAWGCAPAPSHRR